MTATDSTAARAAAVKLIRSQLGLSDAINNWTYDQRATYTRTLAQYYLDHPQDFTATDGFVASNVVSNATSPLADVSVSEQISELEGAIADNIFAAGNKIADVGTGALDSISLIGKALPWIVVAGLLFGGYVVFKKYAPK